MHLCMVFIGFITEKLDVLHVTLHLYDLPLGGKLLRSPSNIVLQMVFRLYIFN